MPESASRRSIRRTRRPADWGTTTATSAPRAMNRTTSRSGPGSRPATYHGPFGPMTDQAQTDARLRIDNLSKSFPGTQDVSDVSLEVSHGEIRALVGGNGSGKSTLIKILAGVQPADPGGRITVSGESIAAEDITPEWSFAAALAFVHQDPGLFDQLSVAENVFVGLPYPRRAGRIDWRRLNREAASILGRLRVKVSPHAPLSGLRASDRTLVAIARA